MCQQGIARTRQSRYHYTAVSSRRIWGIAWSHTYRLGKKGTFRSVNVFAHKIKVRQNERNVIETSAKNESWIGHVVKIRYAVSALAPMAASSISVGIYPLA